jgi:tetratricopeptide (TPR) repeat protein
MPDNVAIHLNYADLLTELGRGVEAAREYETAAQLAPGSFDVQYRLAQAYARNGRLPDALARLRTALALAEAQGRPDVALDIRGAIRSAQADIAARTH